MICGRRNDLRARSGSVSAELPLCLLILFIFFAFPLFNLVTVGLRYGFVFYACQSGCRDAAGAATFVKNRASSLSAKTKAEQTVQYICSLFSGIRLRSVETKLIGTPLVPGSASYFETAQPLPPKPGPDTDNYLYQYRIKVRADVDPLVTYNGRLLGDIPGFTRPLDFTCYMERVCEKPEGIIE